MIAQATAIAAVTIRHRLANAGVDLWHSSTQAAIVRCDSEGIQAIIEETHAMSIIHRTAVLAIRLGLLLPIIVLLAGCEALDAAANPGSNNSAGPTQRQLIQSADAAPADVVRQFFTAWDAQDLDTMYSLLSPQSRQLYEFPVFENRYTLLQQETSYEGLTYSINEVREQGESAAVYHDISIQSPVFGEIRDVERIMRLVFTNQRWQIAWTPMDILKGWASQVSLRAETRFPQRANIYDRNGQALVEQNGQIIALWGVQQDMASVDGCISLLATLMQTSVPQVRQLFQGYNTDTLFYIGELEPARYNANQSAINQMCGAGIASTGGFDKVQRYQNRAYYGHGSAAHVTGYIGSVPADELTLWRSRGYQPDDLIGRTGIELAYEEELAGKPERLLRLIEPGGAIIRELGGTLSQEPTPVTLTLDRGLQDAVAQAVADAYNYAAINWASVANGTAVVAMRVDTGEILALYSYPSYDPSLFNPQSSYPDALERIGRLQSSRRVPLSNKAVQEQYTPGSIWKIITTAAAKQEEVFTEDIFQCDLFWEGSQYGDTVPVRQDWRVVDELPAAGPVRMYQALATSCNPFFWEMGARLYQKGPGLLADYAAEMGFGQRTGIGVLGSEAQGNLARPNSATAAINNAIGQGDVSITVLQMVNSVAAIANGGTLYRPQIVRQVGGMDGTEVQQEFQPDVLRELGFRQDVIDMVQQGMCAVPVDEQFGTAVSAFGEDVSYTSCGKTGTAQAGTAASGIPPHAWYASYAPADDPEIAIVVLTLNSREGSEVAAPITRRIYDYYFNAPQAPFPDWWETEYIPIDPPAGVAPGNS